MSENMRGGNQFYKVFQSSQNAPLARPACSACAAVRLVTALLRLFSQFFGNLFYCFADVSSIHLFVLIYPCGQHLINSILKLRKSVSKNEIQKFEVPETISSKKLMPLKPSVRYYCVTFNQQKTKQDRCCEQD